MSSTWTSVPCEKCTTTFRPKMLIYNFCIVFSCSTGYDMRVGITRRLRHTRPAVLISWMAYRSEVSCPIRVKTVCASSLSSTSSSSQLKHKTHVCKVRNETKLSSLDPSESSLTESLGSVWSLSRSREW